MHTAPVAWGPRGDHTPCTEAHETGGTARPFVRKQASDLGKLLTCPTGGQGVAGSNPVVPTVSKRR
jgi:hypothetical protein